MFDSYFEKKFSAFNIFHFPNFEISVSLHLTGTRNTVIIVLTAMVKHASNGAKKYATTLI